MNITLNTPPIVNVTLTAQVNSNGTPIANASILDFGPTFGVTTDGYGTVFITDPDLSYVTLTFTSSGKQRVGDYLLTGSIPSSVTGQIIPGTGILQKFGVGVSTNITGTPCIFQIQKRTAVGTFTDIAGATLSIPVGAYQASTTLAIQLGTDEELSVYYKSGGAPSNSVATIFVTPQ